MNRDKIQILTKFGLRWDSTDVSFIFKSKDNSGRDLLIYRLASAKSIMKECENSLKRLKTDYIDLYKIHWHDSTTPIAETMEALQRLFGTGKIRAGRCLQLFCRTNGRSGEDNIPGFQPGSIQHGVS